MTRLSALMVGTTAAGALLLGACSPTGAPQPPAARPSSTPALTPLPKITPPAQAPNDAAGRPTGGPVTGRQKAYLKAAAKPGEFVPAALERGLEACDRASYISQIDRRQLVRALRADEVPGAGAAIPFLCPQHAPLMAEAKGGFVDGTTTRVQAGTYTAPAASGACQWQVVEPSGKRVTKGSDGPYTLTVSGGETVTSRRCVVWLPAEK